MRYITQPATSWSEVDGKQFLARTVHEAEPHRVDTGLLDAAGVKLYRVHEPNPIGFTARLQKIEGQ